MLTHMLSRPYFRCTGRSSSRSCSIGAPARARPGQRHGARAPRQRERLGEHDGAAALSDLASLQGRIEGLRRRRRIHLRQRSLPRDDVAVRDERFGRSGRRLLSQSARALRRGARVRARPSGRPREANKGGAHVRRLAREAFARERGLRFAPASCAAAPRSDSASSPSTDPESSATHFVLVYLEVPKDDDSH